MVTERKKETFCRTLDIINTVEGKANVETIKKIIQWAEITGQDEVSSPDQGKITIFDKSQINGSHNLSVPQQGKYISSINWGAIPMPGNKTQSLAAGHGRAKPEAGSPR